MSDTGRYYIKDQETGRVFWVEPIYKGNQAPKWGDFDPVEKKYTGQYGQKHKGSIVEEDSIIKEENGFKNIVTLEPGQSPEDYIKKLLKKS